jgi:DNA repair protein RadC
VQGNDVLSTPEQVRHYLALKMSHLEHEVFAAIFLDTRHRIKEYRELFTGTIDSAAVYPREVVKQCLACNSAAVIFAHNHPSGVSEPTDTDVRLTRRLTDALALVDVRVLDHIVIGKGEMTSLAERGLM